MKKVAALYVTGTMLWAIYDTERIYRLSHFRPFMAGMFNFDVAQGLWLVFALPGTLFVHFMHWSPHSPVVTVASSAFWWAAWTIRKRFTRVDGPAPASLMQSGPAEMIGWDRDIRTAYEEDWP